MPSWDKSSRFLFDWSGVGVRLNFRQTVLWGVLRLWVFALCAAGIPAAVSASDLQFALQSLEETGQVSVTREGTCAGYSWTIKWKSPGGKQPLLQVPSLGQLFVPQQCFLLHCFLNSAFCYFVPVSLLFATLFLKRFFLLHCFCIWALCYFISLAVLLAILFPYLPSLLICTLS